jgi:PAS domain S-box-containing protein
MKLDDTPSRALSANPAERLVDAIDLPIGRWGRDATLLFCNGPYTRWAGRPGTELVGNTLAQLYGAAAWAAARDAFAQAFNGSTVSYERRLTHQSTHAGAAARWARVQVFPDRNAQGEVEAVYTIAFDIHQDVMEREQLLEARQRLNHFTEHIPYPLTYVDREYRLCFVNLAYQQAVGMPATALVGRPIGEVRGPARWAEHQPYFDRALAGEAVQYTRLVPDLQDSPQGARWMRTSYVPDHDDHGAVQGVYTVTVDVHELTEAQQRLARTAERDALTDALSRRTMMERLDAAAASCGTQPMALFFIDLDGFKGLNDAHGLARAGLATGGAIGRCGGPFRRR